MASNVSTIFQKIENMLMRMAYNLPDFERFIVRLDAITPQGVAAQFPRLTQAVFYIYEDMLGFCHRVCTLLSGSRDNGLIIPSPVFILS